MKKLLLLSAVFLLVLTSCGGDDDPAYVPPVGQSFSFDNNNYTLLSFQGITQTKMENILTAGGNPYDRITLSLIGMIGFTETATVSFDLYVKDGLPVGGTYPIFDDVDGEESFPDFVAPIDRSCLGWLTTGVVFHNNSGTDFTDANNPSGTVTVTVNSANNYTIQFNGNFKEYDDELNFVRNVPVTVNVTGDVYFAN